MGRPALLDSPATFARPPHSASRPPSQLLFPRNPDLSILDRADAITDYRFSTVNNLLVELGATGGTAS